MKIRTTAAAFCALTMAFLIGSNGHAQFGGGANSEQKLVARYDKDKDGKLNREERNAARAAVGGGQQFGFRRGFRGAKRVRGSGGRGGRSGAVGRCCEGKRGRGGRYQRGRQSENESYGFNGGVW